MDNSQLSEIKNQCADIIGSISKILAGNKRWLVKILAAGLSGGHILLGENPGTGRKQMVKAFALITGLNYSCIHFSPDLLPVDITGSQVLVPEKSEFDHVKGPIFTNVLLAREIDCTPPKMQSYLLEAMQERIIKLEGIKLPLPEPFIVLATQNFPERESPYPLMASRMDRFRLKLSPGYPESLEEESDILSSRIAGQRDIPDQDARAVISADRFVKIQAKVKEVYIDKNILDYVSLIIRKTREHPRVEIGINPAGAVALLKVSRAMALISGRDYVTPDDVKNLLTEALAHRLILKREASERNIKPEDILAEVVNSIPVPFEIRAR